MDSMVKEIEELLNYCGVDNAFINPDIAQKVTDINISVKKPVTLYTPNGKTELIDCFDSEKLDELFLKICDYSVYKHTQEIKNGFITLKNKYRCGICGTAVYKDDSLISIKNISSVNIRIPRNVKGAADELIKRCKGELLYGVLIVGEPSSGKTTVLKDLLFYLENRRVALIDERYELYIGQKCDVLLGMDKKKGFGQLMRTMSPEIIVCDEIDEKDIDAIEYAMSSGISVIASAHGDLNSKNMRPALKKLIDTGAFKTLVQLKSRANPGEIKKIYKYDNFLEVKNESIRRFSYS